MNIEQFFARLQSSFSALSGKQLGSLAVAFVAVVALTIGSATWLNTPTYGVLFADMDSESASTVVSKLKTQKIDYVLDAGGKTIRVPFDRVDELRLQFGAEGLPGSGRLGFELFDRTSFGVTDFLEHVNYRRALEGELARTISTISEVAGARVHIAMPQPSLFTGRDQPTKASVVLKLRGNRQLSPSTVAAITGMVSASVESLRPEAVVIIDNFGRPLSKSESGDQAAEGLSLERQQRIERDLTTKALNLLEPFIGSGRVRVNVSATLKSDTREATEERWDPTPVIRSTQSVVQAGPASGVSTGASPAPLAVAGARSNLPPDPNAPADTGAATVATAALPGSHTAETTNFEVGKTTTHIMQPSGDIARLSVAVVLDDERPSQAAAADGAAAVEPPSPRSAADIQKIQALVASAVGFDADRGDQITVENFAFEETPVEELVPPGVWQRFGPMAMEVGRILGIVVLGLVAVLGVIRPMVRGALSATPAASRPSGPATVAARTVQDLEAEMDAQLAAGTPTGSQRMPALTRRVGAMTQREPENAARLLRTWLTESER